MPPTPDQQNPPAASPDPQQQAAAATSGSAPSQATPIDQSSAAAVPAAAPTTAPASAAASVQAPANAQQQQHGIKHVLGDIFQTLAGGQKIVYTQDPNSNRLVKTYQDLKPGEMARGILAAAITGLASGYDPANRGKGPAMSSAFASGFRGEDQERKGLEAKKEQEAQQQFVNQNASDELLLKKHQDAREQQEAHQKSQETSQIMEEAKVKAQQQTTLFDQGQLDRLNAQDDAYRKALILGKIVQDPTKPGQDLVLHTKDEADAFVAKHPELTLAPGQFDTKPYQRPGVGGFVIIKTPLSDKEKEDTYFAKRNPTTGKIMYDSSGQMIPTGQRDMSGNIIQPGKMTGQDYQNKMDEVMRYEDHQLTWQQKLAQISKEKAEAEKDLSVLGANKQLADAGNDPTAMDIHTGFPKMSFKNREVMASFYTKSAQNAQTAINKMREQLQTATDTDAKDLREAIKKAQDDQDGYRNAIAAMSRKTTPEASMAQSLLDEYDNDPKKALSFFEEEAKKGDYKASQLDLNKVRASLAAATATAATAAPTAAAANPKTAAEDFSKGESKKGEDQMAASVNQNAQEWQRPADPKTIGGGMSRIPQQQNPNFNDAEAYIAAHPNLTPDERAAVRNQNDIKNGKVRPPTIQIQGEDGKPKTIPDPKAEEAIQALQGHDRNDIRRFIANQDKMTNEQKAALYNYYYLTPPSAKQ